jgi:hypothetical protein
MKGECSPSSSQKLEIGPYLESGEFVVDLRTMLTRSCHKLYSKGFHLFSAMTLHCPPLIVHDVTLIKVSHTLQTAAINKTMAVPVLMYGRVA